MPQGHGLLRRLVNDRSWRDLTVKTGVNKRQVLAPTTDDRAWRDRELRRCTVDRADLGGRAAQMVWHWYGYGVA
jgi:hypothetical protein